MDQVLVISPKRHSRDAIMPRLAGLLRAIKGVQILGEGSTNIKVKVDSSATLERNLERDVLNNCFIEPAAQFSLAKNQPS